MMPGKISKRRRKLAQYEPILNRSKMAASQDIKNQKSQFTKNAAVFTFLFRQVIFKLLQFLNG
jgi:hypothetical protein